MPDAATTEREVAGEISRWFNELIQAGGYPFEMTTVEPSLGKGVTPRFPDIQIWLNRKAIQGFCGIELKSPDVPVDDAALLENAAEKAARMNADYFVTCNLRDTVIWRRPQEREVTSEHRLKTYPAIYQVTKFDDVWEEYTATLLNARAQTLLNDLATLYREGHLHLIDTDTTFFVGRLNAAVRSIAPHVDQALRAKVGRDVKFREGLNDWTVKQGIPNFGDESFYKAISRQIVYRILGRIIFYQTLMRFRSDLPKIELREEDPASIDQRLKEHFEQARRIDWQAVFEPDFTDKVPIPASAGEELAKLIDDLNRFNFSTMPIDVVGRVFEQLIPYEERHDLGQYFTREDLVDLIVASCVRSREDFVLDPTCGSGTFLVRAYDRLKFFGERDHRKLLSQLWGIDIAHFPAELATINLYRQDLSDYNNFPRIDARDFFKVKPGQVFRFPPPKPTEVLEFIEEKLPVFNAAMGNFPYIRQELIERQVKGYKEQLEEALAEDWFLEYPQAFDMPKSTWTELEQAKKNGLDISRYFAEADLRLSGQADIYAYLFFHSARHIQEGGRMGFVTSNAWLDVGYGYELQRFFLNNFKIIAILESRCEPWFEDPAVNTIVTILERCSDQEERDNHLVKFVKVKRRLHELFPWDMKMQAMERWAGIDRLVHRIESKGSEHLRLVGEKYENTLKGHATYEDEDFRIRVLRQGELREEVEEAGKTVKWGRYLRAPEVYFEILKAAGDKLVPLRQIAEPRRGYTTGINQFFYLDEETIKHWGIEEEFLAPVLKSPKEFEGILIDPTALEVKVFLCSKSKEELRKESKLGALRYIEWGEKQTTTDGVPWPEVPTVRHRPYWYTLSVPRLTKVFWTKSYDIRFLQRFCEERIHADQRVYQILEKDGVPPKLLAAILNSSVFSLLIELSGRVNLGDGALDTTVEEAREYMLIPDVTLFPEKTATSVLKAFDTLLSRPMKPAFDEVKMKDRRSLDGLVLKALGLDPKKYQKPIYDGLTELVRERIELAKMRKTITKAKRAKDVAKLKSQVIDEVLPDGPKSFPDVFLDPSLKKNDFVEISIPGDPLKLGLYFMGRQEVVSDSGFRYDAKSVEEAKYLVYAQKSHSYLVKVPKAEAGITKAVTGYERYLRGLRDKFFEIFFDRTLDHSLADRITNNVFEEIGLPLVPSSP